MKITWATVAWLIWCGAMLVAFGGAGLAVARRKVRGLIMGMALLLSSLLMFGFVSGITGLYEIEGYAQTNRFWISLVAAVVGAGIFGFNLRRVTRHG